MKRRIQLSDNFDNRRILKFVAPSIIMMICTSVYTIVDGFFVSNFVGKTEFAALNLIMPFLILMGILGFMMGSGGTAIVSYTLGENKKDQACSYFSLIVWFTLAGGILIAVIGELSIFKVSEMLGARGLMLKSCVIYGRTVFITLPAFMLQYLFQTFLVAAEKPRLGLFFTICSGSINILLDALFIIGFQWGLKGAAIATCMGELFGGLGPMIYFLLPNDSLLQLGRTKFNIRIIVKSITNGSSEFMSNFADSLVTILYNWQLLRFAGENGVAAFGAIMYICFISVAVFLGYSMGIAPVISYHHGAENRSELRNLFKRSMMITASVGIIIFILSELLAGRITDIFVGYDEYLSNMTLHGLRIYAISFLLIGINIFASGFFTALGDGVTSAKISFLRAVVFESAAVLLLPLIFEIEGIWAAVIAAESAALIISVFFMIKKKSIFGY